MVGRFPGYQTCVLGLCVTLITKMLRVYHQEDPVEVQDSTLHVLYPALDHIHQHYMQSFPLDDLAGKWADFQKIFTRAVGLKRELSLEQAVNIADISFEGHQHDALWDARNTAELYRIYRDEGRFNTVIGPLREAVNPKKQTSFTLADALGDALKGLNLPEA